MKQTRCNHTFRSGPLHPSIVIGGASMGQCEKPVVEGLVVCLEHATKDALHLLIQQLRRKLKT